MWNWLYLYLLPSDSISYVLDSCGTCPATVLWTTVINLSDHNNDDDDGDEVSMVLGLLYFPFLFLFSVRLGLHVRPWKHIAQGNCL